jgi:hypothetical protein
MLIGHINFPEIDQYMTPIQHPTQRLSFIATVIGVSALFAFTGCGETDHCTRVDAITMAEQFVSERLKSPSTAEFADLSEWEITTSDKKKWQVAAYVDSQNSFGGIVRTHFTGEMLCVGDGTWKANFTLK